jgi:hypothetical protein
MREWLSAKSLVPPSLMDYQGDMSPVSLGQSITERYSTSPLQEQDAFVTVLDRHPPNCAILVFNIPKRQLTFVH